MGAALTDELVSFVQQHATSQHYQFAGGISIDLVEDASHHRGHAAGRLREREGRRRLDAGARHRRQALPAHAARTTVIGRGSDADITVDDTGISPQARADHLGRPPRPGARPRLHERLAAERPARAQGHPRARVGDQHRPHAHRVPRAAARQRRRHPGAASPTTQRDATTSAASGASREPERTHAARPALRLPSSALGVRLRHRLRPAHRPVRPAGAQAARGPGRRGPGAVALSLRHPRPAPPRPPCSRRPSPTCRPGANTASGTTEGDARHRDPPRHHVRSATGHRAPPRPRADHDRPLERIRASSSATTTPPPTTPVCCSGTTSG